MLTVRVFYKDGSEDLKEVLSLNDICLLNVLTLKVIRTEKVA